MKKNDIILFGAVFLAAVLAAVLFRGYSQDGDCAVIISDGEEYARLPLEEDVSVSVNGKNTVEIKNREVYVSYADCPDQICVSQGKITGPGRTIVCLPNKMSVRIEKRGE